MGVVGGVAFATTASQSQPASRWPPVVASALRWVAGHQDGLQAPIGGPQNPAAPSGPLAAAATVHPHAFRKYTVTLNRVPRAWPVNSPDAQGFVNRHAGRWFMSWTVRQLGLGPRSGRRSALSVAQAWRALYMTPWEQPSGIRHPATITPGLTGWEYPSGTLGQLHQVAPVVLWHQRGWVLEVRAGAMPRHPMTPLVVAVTSQVARLPRRRGKLVAYWDQAGDVVVEATWLASTHTTWWEVTVRPHPTTLGRLRRQMTTVSSWRWADAPARST